MNKYRIVKNVVTYEVQYFGVINYDGILERDWKTLRNFPDEKTAKEYIEKMITEVIKNG